MFEPSFDPIETLNLQALKRGAAGPALLFRKLARNAVLHPARELLLHFPAQARLGGTPRFSNRCHLIPGGRYLFGCSSAQLGLWDLGPPCTPVGAQPYEAKLLDVFDCAETDPRVELHGISGPLLHSGTSLRFGAYLGDAQGYTFER